MLVKTKKFNLKPEKPQVVIQKGTLVFLMDLRFFHAKHGKEECSWNKSPLKNLFLMTDVENGEWQIVKRENGKATVLCTLDTESESLRDMWHYFHNNEPLSPFYDRFI